MMAAGATLKLTTSASESNSLFLGSISDVGNGRGAPQSHPKKSMAAAIPDKYSRPR